MNVNPILQREIGTRRDNQYKIGENELIKLIKSKKLISKFEPNTSNLSEVLKNKNIGNFYSLN